MTYNQGDGTDLYDESGKPLDQGIPPGKRGEGIIFEGVTGLDRNGFEEDYEDFVERFQGDYDLDDLLRDFGFEETSTTQIELVDADEDSATYNLNAGTLTIEAGDEGWRLTYEQDERLETNIEGITETGHLPVWAKILTGQDMVTRDGNFVKSDEYDVGDEPDLVTAIDDIRVADFLLAGNSDMRQEYLIESE